MKTLTPITQHLQKATLTILLSMSCFMLHAQNPLVKQWDKRFGGINVEWFSQMQQTSDGGYILGGYSQSDSTGDKTQINWGSIDYWIVKIDSLGNKIWDKRFGGTDYDDLYTIKQTNDGGYILGGYSASGIGGDKSQANWGTSNTVDYWVVKTDSLGNKQWDNRYGGIANDYLYALQETKDGGYILGGSSYSGINGDKTETNWGADDYWIVKIDSLGNKQWDKRYGGGGFEHLSSIKQTTDGGYILGGVSNSEIGGDKSTASWDTIHFTFDYWVVKVDSIGNKEWDKVFGGIYDDWLYDVQQTINHGYILGGLSSSGISGNKTTPLWGSNDFWIVKTDSIGNMEWDNEFGGTDIENSFGNISLTLDSGYLLAGSSLSSQGGNKSENNLGVSQSWIIKIDTNGIKQWDKTIFSLGQDEYGYAIQTNDGNYLVANTCKADTGGYKTQNSWNGSYDYWVVKFSGTTGIVHSPLTNFSSSDTNFCNKKCIDFTDLSTNNPTSWQWFFPGSDSLMSNMQNPTGICYNTYGSFDVTLIACNAAGCDTLFLPGFINEYQQPTPTITQSNDTLFSSPAVAYQWWSVDSGLIVGATNSYYVPPFGGSYFVIVTDTIGCNGSSNTIVISGINQFSNFNYQMSILPNPNNGTFTITLNTAVKEDASIRITDVLGRVVHNGTWFAVGQSATVNLSNLLAGLYEVELSTYNKVYRQKFVKQ